MNKVEILTLLLGLFVVLVNVLSFGISYNHALKSGLSWNNQCTDDVTVSESLLLLANDSGFATSMAIISAVCGAVLLYVQFSDHKYIISIMYLLGMIFFSVLPFVVINPPPTTSIAPLAYVPTTKVTQVYNPTGHGILAGLYGFCMCMCMIISTWIYTRENRDQPHRIVLYIVISIVFCLLISFMGSMIDSSMHKDGCLEQNQSNKWFSVTEFMFLLMVNIWIIIIASPYKISPFPSKG